MALAGSWSHISKHSLFRLKITVGCRLCTCPSIHFSLDEDTLKITVGCLVCGVVCCVSLCACGVGGVWVVYGHVVLCVVCVVCCGGVCVVVLWWCVCVVCGEAWHTLSLVLSPSSSLSLSFSLLSFFFSCFFSYSCSCSCSFSFSSFFFLPSNSLFSSLPFTPTNTVQSTDQQTRRTTLRRLNVMWRTVRSWQLPTNCTECSHLSSSLLFSPPSSLPPTP